MLLDRKNKVVIGFDLGNDYSQISYCRPDQSMPETFSLVNGEEQYNIPTVMYHKSFDDSNAKWYIGRDALAQNQDGSGVFVEDLVLLAKNNVNVQVGDDEYSISQLLSIFIKKAFAMLSNFVRTEDIGGIAFTLKEMNASIMDQLRAAVQELKLKSVQVYFMSREDCFYQYMIHQPEEMWLHDVILYDYRTDGIKSYQMKLNRKTRPIVCYMDIDTHPQMKTPELSSMRAGQKEAFFAQLDDAFLEIAREQCETKLVTSVFLLGDIFSKEWCKESLRFLCHGRRVFQGNNLFSKGACYGARERLMPSSLSKDFVFLSEDKLKANIGLPCTKDNEEYYIPLLDAGTNWFEARKQLDVILAKDNKVTISVTPLDGGVPRLADITLEGFAVRGNRTNRVGINILMKDVNTVVIEIRDKGFGDFYPASGQIWREEFSLDLFSPKG